MHACLLLTGVDIMKKEQEMALQQQQQHKSNSVHASNHVGSSNPPLSHHVVENHVPHQSKSGLLAKVGLSGGVSEHGSSLVASAVAGAGVDSALVGGGQAARVVRHVPRVGAMDPAAASVEFPVVEDRAPAGPTKLPPSMTSPPTTTAKKKDAGSGGRRGVASSGDTPQFSQLLNPVVIDDHFDQYLSGRQLPPSSSPPLADEFPAFSYDNRPSHESPQGDGRSRAIQRRKTLPGRPPGPLLVGDGGSNPGHRPPAPMLTGKRDNEAVSFVAAAAAATATAASAVPVYRKQAAAVPPPPTRAPAVGPRLRKASAGGGGGGGGNRGSMPDVSECASATATVNSPSMPREEVHVLSQLRREELRRLREEAARRHQQDIVLRLGDIKVSSARFIQSRITGVLCVCVVHRPHGRALPFAS